MSTAATKKRQNDNTHDACSWSVWFENRLRNRHNWLWVSWFPSCASVKCRGIISITSRMLTWESTPSQRLWRKTQAARTNKAAVSTNAWAVYTIHFSALHRQCYNHVITTWATSHSVSPTVKHAHITRPKLSDATNGALRANQHRYWWPVIYSTCGATPWTSLSDVTHFIVVESLHRQVQQQR
jgi:hypothetical protein